MEQESHYVQYPLFACAIASLNSKCMGLVHVDVYVYLLNLYNSNPRHDDSALGYLLVFTFLVGMVCF